MNPLPILYSFRRCPYAIRARMALNYAGIEIEHREILLKEKPPEMLAVSAKGTVPVLVCSSGAVIDESLDIMHWALAQQDPKYWRAGNEDSWMKDLIAENDNEFKPRLDKYKYAVRYPENSAEYYREQCLRFLQKLDHLLAGQPYLTGKEQRLADVAIFPFVRQCNGVDPGWVKEAGLTNLWGWLDRHLESDLFLSTMKKHPVWCGEESLK